MEVNNINRNNRLYTKKLFTGVPRRSLRQNYSSESESSELENDNVDKQTSDEDLNQYERINDRNSGASTGSSGLSHNYQGSVGKITHYAESAIYKRSKGMLKTFFLFIEKKSPRFNFVVYKRLQTFL